MDPQKSFHPRKANTLLPLGKEYSLATLRTAEHNIVQVFPYDPTIKADSSTLGMGFIVVRDDHNFPLGFASAYTVTQGRYMLAPIVNVDEAETGVYGITVRPDQNDRVLTASRLSSVVGMLIEFGMYIRSATRPEHEAIDVFRQSLLYRTEAFWMYLWAGVGHFYSLVSIELPARNMIILNDNMLRVLRHESVNVRIEQDLQPFEVGAARYGHFIGMQLAIEELKLYEGGTIVMPNMAVEIFTRAKTRIVFPPWMNRTPE